MCGFTAVRSVKRLSLIHLFAHVWLHSCKISKMIIFDSLVCTCVASMAPAIAHHFGFEAFAAFYLAFFVVVVVVVVVVLFLFLFWGTITF